MQINWLRIFICYYDRGIRSNTEYIKSKNSESWELGAQRSVALGSSDQGLLLALEALDSLDSDVEQIGNGLTRHESSPDSSSDKCHET